jgi:hypothetical protein
MTSASVARIMHPSSVTVLQYLKPVHFKHLRATLELTESPSIDDQFHHAFSFHSGNLCAYPPPPFFCRFALINMREIDKAPRPLMLCLSIGSVYEENEKAFRAGNDIVQRNNTSLDACVDVTQRSLVEKPHTASFIGEGHKKQTIFARTPCNARK